jgi:23S rRNA (uridine2552-2'-O)-methyltransferase
LPKAWLQDRKRDYYYKKAKEEKYRSRAAYKLFQAVKKYQFIKSGSVVVDLGAAVNKEALERAGLRPKSG